MTSHLSVVVAKTHWRNCNERPRIPVRSRSRGVGRRKGFHLLQSASRRHGGLAQCIESTLAAWESGPVLHLHKESDESFYVLSGELELQIGDKRSIVSPGGFA